MPKSRLEQLQEEREHNLSENIEQTRTRPRAPDIAKGHKPDPSRPEYCMLCKDWVRNSADCRLENLRAVATAEMRSEVAVRLSAYDSQTADGFNEWISERLSFEGTESAPEELKAVDRFQLIEIDYPEEETPMVVLEANAKVEEPKKEVSPDRFTLIEID